MSTADVTAIPRQRTLTPSFFTGLASSLALATDGWSRTRSRYGLGHSFPGRRHLLRRVDLAPRLFGLARGWARPMPRRVVRGPP